MRKGGEARRREIMEGWETQSAVGLLQDTADVIDRYLWDDRTGSDADQKRPKARLSTSTRGLMARRR